MGTANEKEKDGIEISSHTQIASQIKTETFCDTSLMFSDPLNNCQLVN